MARPRVPLEARFTKNGPVPGYAPHLGPCWIWLRTKNRLGYGQIRVGTRNVPAHREVYEHYVGPIPEGLHLDHLCRVTSCVNPSHLEPVTPRENCMRGFSFAAVNAKKTHCDKGHPLKGDNLLVGTTKRRGKVVERRRCRLCNREEQARFRQRNPGYFKPYNDRKQAAKVASRAA